MAGGDSLCCFTPLETDGKNFLASNTYSPPGLRNRHPVLAFSDADNDEALFTGILPRHYAGNGLLVIVIWSATATSGNAAWTVHFLRMEDEGTDMDTAGLEGSDTTGYFAAPATSGALQYSILSVAPGTAMDSLAAGEMFQLWIGRQASSDSADTITGDVQLHGIEIVER